MGGHQGRALRPGDLLFLAPTDLSRLAVGAAVPKAWRPSFCSGEGEWTVGVLPGEGRSLREMCGPFCFLQVDQTTLSWPCPSAWMSDGL